MYDKIRAMSKEDLKRAGLKTTLPRIKILSFLENSSQNHWSAEAMHQALIDEGNEIGLATVYRVLTQFEAASLVTRHYFEGGRSIFELNQGEHHDHLVCVACGRVDEFVDDVIEQRQHAIAKEAGYQMLDHALNIYGLCQSCSDGAPTEALHSQ